MYVPAVTIFLGFGHGNVCEKESVEFMAAADVFKMWEIIFECLGIMVTFDKDFGAVKRV